ncbi:hypothetical protein ES705_15343 [subsurface metagenome]
MEDKLIIALKQTLEEKKISPETASRFIECSPKQVYLWIKGQSKPHRLYRKAIQRGLKRMKKLL